MSKQTFVITPQNYPRLLEVLGNHAAVLTSRATFSPMHGRIAGLQYLLRGDWWFEPTRGGLVDHTYR